MPGLGQGEQTRDDRGDQEQGESGRERAKPARSSFLLLELVQLGRPAGEEEFGFEVVERPFAPLTPLDRFGETRTAVEDVLVAAEPDPFLARLRDPAVDEQAGPVFVDPRAE